MDMKVQIEEAQGKFQEIMQHILKGKSVLIMDKHKAVARIAPVESDMNSGEEDKWTSDDFDIQLSKDQ